MKTLIVYYSYEGATAYYANRLSKIIEADILPIQPIKEKKLRGVVKFIWGGYQAVMKKVPELDSYELNINDYDFILVGTPVWAGCLAPPIRSFLEKEALRNKKIGLFFTHEGGVGQTIDEFLNYTQDNQMIGYFDINSRLHEKEENFSNLKIWIEKVKEQI